MGRLTGCGGQGSGVGQDYGAVEKAVVLPLLDYLKDRGTIVRDKHTH